MKPFQYIFSNNGCKLTMIGKLPILWKRNPLLAQLKCTSTTAYLKYSTASPHKLQSPPKTCHSYGVPVNLGWTKKRHASKHLTTQFRLSTRTSSLQCHNTHLLFAIFVEPLFCSNGQIVTLLKPVTFFAVASNKQNSYCCLQWFSILIQIPTCSHSLQNHTLVLQGQFNHKWHQNLLCVCLPWPFP